jgi:hypothetical protein
VEYFPYFLLVDNQFLSAAGNTISTISGFLVIPADEVWLQLD